MQPGHRWLGVAAGLLAAGLISGSVCGDAQAQAHAHHLLDRGDQDHEAGPLDGLEAPEQEHDAALVLPQHANRTGEIDEDCNAENEGPLHARNIAYPAGAVEQARPAKHRTVARDSRGSRFRKLRKRAIIHA